MAPAPVARSTNGVRSARLTSGTAAGRRWPHQCPLVDTPSAYLVSRQLSSSATAHRGMEGWFRLRLILQKNAGRYCVRREVLVDNVKTAVDRVQKGKARVINARF